MKKLIITAGHSLKQAGASANREKEELLTIEMKNLIVDQLKEWGYEPWTDNDNDSLSQVIAKTKAIATADDILLDIHFNAGISSAKGTETFIAVNARDKSKRIAQRITDLTSAMLGTPNRGVKLENQSQHPRLGMLHSAASSVLWEVDFLTNKDFMENYHLVKKRLAIGIANILVQELEK